MKIEDMKKKNTETVAVAEIKPDNKEYREGLLY